MQGRPFTFHHAVRVADWACQQLNLRAALGAEQAPKVPCVPMCSWPDSSRTLPGGCRVRRALMHTHPAHAASWLCKLASPPALHFTGQQQLHLLTLDGDPLARWRQRRAA